MAVAVCKYNVSLLFLMIGIVLSMVPQISTDNVQSNRFVGYPKDGHIYKVRRDGSAGYHEYEYYNYGYVNCGPGYGYFGGYPNVGFGGYPGYDYPGYGGYPYGIHAQYGAPYF